MRLSIAMPVLVVALFALPGGATRAAKTDVLILMNGDHITGEIKKLEYGMLEYSTDSMSKIYIEWKDVRRLTSTSFFEVEIKNGSRYFGRFDEPVRDGALVVAQATGAVQLEMLEVVRVRPIKQTFWSRMDGSLSAGLNYTRASEVLQASFSFDTTYRHAHWESTFKLSSIITRQEGRDDQNRDDLSIDYIRFLKNRYFAGGVLAFQRNTELGIAFRTLVGGVAGRHLVQTNRQDFALGGGLATNYEETTSDSDAQQSLEAVATLVWRRYKFDTPKQNLTMSLTVFTGLTGGRRLRGSFDTNWRQEIVVKDFFLNIQLYDNYDSDPPTEDAGNNDFGIILSLGWSW